MATYGMNNPGLWRPDEETEAAIERGRRKLAAAMYRRRGKKRRTPEPKPAFRLPVVLIDANDFGGVEDRLAKALRALEEGQ